MNVLEKFALLAILLLNVGCPSSQTVKPPADVMTDPSQVIAKNEAPFSEIETAQFLIASDGGTKTRVVYTAPNTLTIKGRDSEVTDILGFEFSARDVARLIYGTCPWDAYRAAGTKDDVTWMRRGGYLLKNTQRTSGFNASTGMEAELDTSLVCQRMSASTAQGKDLFLFTGKEWNDAAHAWQSFTLTGPKGGVRFDVSEVNWNGATKEDENLPFEARKYFDSTFEVATLDMPEGPFALGVSPKRIRAAFVWKGEEKIVENYLPIEPCEQGHSLSLSREDRYVVLSVDCVTGEDVLTTNNTTFVLDPSATDPVEWDLLWSGPVGFTESNQLNACAIGDSAKIVVRSGVDLSGDDEFWIVSSPWSEVGDFGEIKPDECNAPEKTPDRKVYPESKR